MISAIEIYNKPGFLYRGETFALLALNAWELLLKAQLLNENGNDPKSIYEYEKRKTRAGTPSKKRYVRRNRAGNPQTVSLGRAIAVLDSNSSTRLAIPVKANLDALLEVRDNAAHFVNSAAVLEKQILEVATANVRNFITQAKAWFKRDLSKKISLLMPLAYLDGARDATVVTVNSDERNVIEFLRKLAEETEVPEGSDFQVALTLNVQLQRSNLASATRVVVTDDPTAVRVVLTEEDIRKNFPWDYRELTRRLTERYSDFKQDQKFHQIRKPLLGNLSLVKSRFLDPSNPRSPKKDFYNPNVLQVFDKHYVKR